MSVNLLELAKRALSGSVLDQLSRTLGVSQEEAQSGIDAALPATLGALMKKAATPSGAEEILAQVQQQDTALLDHLGDLLGGTGQEEWLSTGLTMAQQLFGDQFDSIRDVLGRATGSGGTASSLLSFLVPVVISVLHQQTSQLGLNASGLANMLRQQSEAVKTAMPPELGQILGLDGSRSTAADTVVDSARSVGPTVGRTAESAAGGSRETAIGKLLPLIGLLALALLAWMFIKGGVDGAGRVPGTSDAVLEDVLDAEIETPLAADMSVETAEDLSTETDSGAP